LKRLQFEEVPKWAESFLIPNLEKVPLSYEEALANLWTVITFRRATWNTKPGGLRRRKLTYHATDEVRAELACPCLLQNPDDLLFAELRFLHEFLRV